MSAQKKLKISHQKRPMSEPCPCLAKAVFRIRIDFMRIRIQLLNERGFMRIRIQPNYLSFSRVF
jgi:hypothetical protein